MAAPIPAPSDDGLLSKAVRVAGIAILLAALGLPFLPYGPRVIWTGIIAAVPLGFVLAGYHPWRRACPLAFFGTLGQRLHRQPPRKMGEWMGRNYSLVQLGLLTAALSWRHLAANGTPWALSALFAVVLLTATATSFLFTGKTWCNYLCPVGFVEKAYLDPAGLRPLERNSQCAPCTACKKQCPDIDLEQGYWKEVDLPARRRAMFAWPGLVFGFYALFRLAHGSWDPYFNGSWTLDPHQAEHLLAPGFPFLPFLPRLVAVPLLLIGFGALSFILFSFGERLALGRAVPEEARAAVRHRATALAGFLAFLLFYAYAGQPLLRHLPGAARFALSAGITLVATLILKARWDRSEALFVQEKFAKGLLKRREGELPPEGRLSDLFLLHQERQRQKEDRLRAYKATLRDLLDSGVLVSSNLAVLARVRQELGVEEKEHQKLLSELSAEDRRLLDPAYQGSRERQLQLTQYERALGALIQAGASREVVEALRTAHAMDSADHAAILAKLEGNAGPRFAQASERVQALLDLLRMGRAAASLTSPSPSLPRRRAFFLHLLHLAQLDQLRRLRDLLELSADPGLAAPLDALLQGPPEEAAAQAITYLRSCVDRPPLGPAFAALVTPDPPLPPGPWLRKALDLPLPHLRAAALALLAFLPGEASERVVREALLDADPLVRETAELMMGADAPAPDALQETEAQWLVRAAVRALPAPGINEAGQATLRRKDSAGAPALAALEVLMMLHGVPLFSQLPPEDLEDLRRQGRQRVLQPDETLIREGERSEEAFVVLRGSLRSWRDHAGAPQVLGDLHPGDCAGELAALDPAPRTATLTALEATLILVLPGQAFRDLVRSREGLAFSLLRVAARRLREVLRISA